MGFAFPLPYSSDLLCFTVERQSVHCGEYNLQFRSLLRESFRALAERVGMGVDCEVDTAVTSAKNTKSKVS